MYRQKYFDKISDVFFEYLQGLGISSESLKNYRSDISHFTAWFLFRVQAWGLLAETFTEAVPFLNQKIAQEYKSFLCENKVPTKTINRRLSTLRHLSRFLLVSQILDSDFMEGLSNLSSNFQVRPSLGPLVSEFQEHLIREKISSNTIKNYLSDIKQFISWVENHPSAASH